MAVTTTEIRTLVRYLIGDFSRSLVPGDIFEYDTDTTFTLTESNVISVSKVLKNNVELGSSEYSYDSDTNAVTVTASLTSGDAIEIQYTYYPNYSDTEIDSYISAAIVHLSVSNFYNFEIEDCVIYPDPTESEQNLIAMVASLLIEPDNKSYRLPDITINVPKDLPLHDKIRKTVAVAKKNTHGVFTIL